MAKKPSGKNGDTKTEKSGVADQPAAQAQGVPSLNVLSQYVKDFSFENPGMPNALGNAAVKPSINININVNAKPLSQNDFEVELSVEAKANDGDKVIFNIELVYAGVFRVQNIPQEQLQPVILIECPRLLFPFARQIVADTSRNGGYPQVLLDPIDFAALYQQNMQAQQRAAASKN